MMLPKVLLENLLQKVLSAMPFMEVIAMGMQKLKEIFILLQMKDSRNHHISQNTNLYKALDSSNAFFLPFLRLVLKLKQYICVIVSKLFTLSV